MKALILAAGYGTRLYPMTKTTPKSLIEVKGKPILAYILDNFDKSKYIREIYIVYNNKFHNNFIDFLKNYNYKKQIELITDKYKTKYMHSSIGTIAYFVKLKNINEDLLVVAGDNLFDFDIDRFIEFHNKYKKTCIGIYDIKNKNNARRFGVVELNNYKIINFKEKPKNPKTTLISTLCYILSNYDLHHLNKKIFKENAGELIKHLIDHEQVYAFELKGKWFDIGTHDDLKKARKEF